MGFVGVLLFPTIQPHSRPLFPPCTYFLHTHYIYSTLTDLNKRCFLHHHVLTPLNTIHNYLLCVYFPFYVSGEKTSFCIKPLFYQFSIFRGYPFRKKRLRERGVSEDGVGGLPPRYVCIFQKSISLSPFA